MIIYGALDSVVQEELLLRLYYRIFGVPHFGSHVRFGYLRKYIHISKNEKVLDLGCGDGTLLNLIAYYFGCRGIGVERLPRRAGKAARVRNAFNLNTEYHITDIYSYLDSASGKFDKVFLTEVLEHVADPVAVLTAAAKLLERGGQVIITVPAIKEFPQTSPIPKMFSYGEDRHIRDGLSYSQIQDIALKTNLKLTNITVTFGPLKQRIWETSERIRCLNQLTYALALPLMRILAKLETRVSIERAYGFLVVLKNE